MYAVDTGFNKLAVYSEMMIGGTGAAGAEMWTFECLTRVSCAIRDFENINDRV